MSVSYNGFNTKVLTFEGEKATVGSPIQINKDGNIENATASADFIGVCVSKNGNFAGVQLNGYVEINYSGTAPTCGYVGLAGDGNNGVKTSTSGKNYLVIKVDETNKTVGFIL